MKPRALVIGAVGVAAATGALWLFGTGSTPPDARAVSGGASPQASSALAPDLARPATALAVAPAAVDAGPELAAQAPLPASLQDTVEDGALRVDASGHLVLSKDVRLFFDYYLSASGEESLEALRARIIAAVRAKLPPSAQDEALRLLEDYLAYREATRTLKVPEGSGPEDLSGRLEALRRVRREHLGATAAEAFFFEDEQLDTVTLERMRLEKDPSLSPEERARRVEALEDLLPPDLRSRREEALRPLRQQAAERELLATGATAEDLRQYRLSTEGAEATARLEALDRERAEWKRRLAEFRARREALAQTYPDAAARAAAVQRLLIDSFTPEERLRVQAADAMDAEQPKPAP